MTNKYIAKPFVRQLLERIDIVDVVSKYITLKKQGANYVACCPFHQEKTPSFSVNQSKQFFYCFGCKAHGDAIKFLQLHENFSFVDSVETISRTAGISVVYDTNNASSAQQDTTNKLFALLEKAQIFYANSLYSQNAGIARNYLSGRGVDADIAKQYGVGFSPDGWDNLIKHMSQGQLNDLQQCGLVISNESKSYDRFRNRIMFPIRDRRGRTVGFGARTLQKDDHPKYLNSPETPIFHKSRQLYGLYEARRATRTFTKILVVEGYMDVIGLAKYGIHYAVATLGTATTSNHLQILFKECKKIIFCFDGDNAGRKAAWHALGVALPFMTEGNNVEFLFLPEGEDPDSLVQKQGKESFEDALGKSVTLSNFLLQSLSKDLNLATAEGKSSFCKNLETYLPILPNGVYKEALYDEIEGMVSLSRQQIQAFIKQPSQHFAKPKIPEFKSSGLLEMVLSYLVQFPEYLKDIEVPEKFSSSEYKIINKFVDLISNNNLSSTAEIFARLSEKPDLLEVVAKLASVQHPGTVQPQDLQDVLFRIHKQEQLQALQQQINDLLVKAKQSKLSKVETKQLNVLMQQKIKVRNI